MPNDLRHRASASTSGRDPGGLVSIMAIDEKPASIDPILAGLFRTMRSLSPLSLDALAAEIGTTPETIIALEGGHIRVFRSPAEASRVVESYGRVVGIDTSPMLDRLLPQISDEREPLQRNAPGLHASTAPTVPYALTARAVAGIPPAPLPPPVAAAIRAAAEISPWQDAGREPPARRKPSRMVRRTRRAVIAAAVAAGLLLLAALSMRSGTGLVASTVASMPTGVAKVLQRGLDAIAGAVFGSGRDGFRWIVVDDPRTRKADRLPEAAPRR